MRIIRNERLATYTLVPVESEEQQILASIAAVLKPGDKMSYGGRRRDGDGDEFCAVCLHAGAQTEVQSKTEGRITVTQNVHVGGVELVLRGSTEDDKYEVNGIRNTCFFGSSGLIFLGEVEVDGKQAIITTAKYCKFCGGAMISYLACEWSICDACAAKCEHEYKRGPVHGPEIDIGMGEFCRLCGRGKPKAEGEREKSQLEHHLAVEHELGVNLIYKNTSLTPSQIDYLQKVASAPNN